MIKSCILILVVSAILSAKVVEFSPFVDKGLFNSYTYFKFKATEGFEESTDGGFYQHYIKSKLQYPTDYYRVGASLKLFLTDRGYVVFGGWANISESDSEMSDDDWVGVENTGGQFLERKNIHSNSRIETSNFGVTLGFGWQLKKLKREFDLSLTYDGAFFEYDAYGLSGWLLADYTQMNPDTIRMVPENIGINESTKVLTYTSNHHRILFNLYFPLINFEYVELLRTGITAGVVFVSDKDTHPVKGAHETAMSTSEGLGYVIGSAFAIRIKPNAHFAFELGWYPEWSVIKNTLYQKRYHEVTDGSYQTMDLTGYKYRGKVTKDGTEYHVLEESLSGFENSVVYFNKPVRASIILSF
ncbi:MAG: hypothetical protein OCD01_07320 [Fibrobacterales bacterium]